MRILYLNQQNYLLNGRYFNKLTVECLQNRRMPCKSDDGAISKKSRHSSYEIFKLLSWSILREKENKLIRKIIKNYDIIFWLWNRYAVKNISYLNHLHFHLDYVNYAVYFVCSYKIQNLYGIHQLFALIIRRFIFILYALKICRKYMNMWYLTKLDTFHGF